MKPAIVTWINDLPNSKGVQSQETRNFLSEILALTKEMLCVDLKQRLTSEKVCLKLTDILNRYRFYPDGEFKKQDNNLKLSEDEVDIGMDVLSQIRDAEYYTRGYWSTGTIRFIEDTSRFLTAITCDSGGYTRSPIGLRAETKLVPLYAFGDEQASSLSDCDLYLTQCSAHQDDFRLTKLRSSTPQHIILMHSVLLGQDIKQSFKLRNMAYKRKTSFAVKVREVFPRKKAGSHTTRIGSVSTVQLWSERTYKDPSSLKIRKDGSRSLREFFFTGAGPRRIILYFNSSVLIVRLAKNARIEKGASKSDSMSLRIVPTNRAVDSSFRASLLQASQEETYPGIPLGHTDLDREEENGSFECRSLELIFRCEEDALQFQKSYKALKQEWSHETKIIEQWRKYMGEKIGYAPV